MCRAICLSLVLTLGAAEIVLPAGILKVFHYYML